MNEDRNTDRCETAVDWIERAADGTLDEFEQKRLHDHLQGCAACGALYDDAVAVRGLLHALPPVVCPQRVVDAVLAQVDQESAGLAVRGSGARWRRLASVTTGPSRRLPRPLTPRGWVRAAVAVAAAAAVLVLMPMAVRRAQSPSQLQRVEGPAQQLTAEQRAQALQAAEQARLALGVLARTLDRTSAMAEQNMRASIAAPLRRALEPLGRQEDRQHENPQQERDGRTGALPAAAGVMGKC